MARRNYPHRFSTFVSLRLTPFFPIAIPKAKTNPNPNPNPNPKPKDKNSSPEAQEKFIEISQAYEVLSPLHWVKPGCFGRGGM
jgi:hypothetical protein